MSRYSLQKVREFNELPDTPEKKEISRKFLDNWLSPLEFSTAIEEYIKKHGGNHE